VVDASIALAWSLADEATAAADRALAHVERHGALVPTLWTYEICNVLALLVRRKRIQPDLAASIGLALDALDITSVSPQGAAWRVATTALAQRFSLSVYDAAYLQLAIAADASLATADKALGAAARTYGIDCSG